jgi:type I restriction enzyme S subunit
MISKNSDATIALLEKHFDIAFAAPDGIKKLRELILSLAMQGKLVAQDPSDQPASELLKEIEPEKERLIKEGKIKKSKPLPEIKLEEIPYKIPASWQWVRFFTINVVKSELVSAKDYPLEKQIAPDSIEKGSGRLLYHRNVEESGAKGPNNRFYKNQILYSKIRPSLNKAVIAPYSGLCSADMYPIETFVDINFMLKSILSEMFLEQVRQAENRVKMPKLNLDSLGIFLIPLPPLAEQRLIVAKIDELMARCDELERLRGDRDRKQITVHNSALDRLLIAKEQSDFNTAWQFITQHFSELYSVKANVTELRKTILQLAVMGKLVPQNPNDQPASELLKEIEEEKERLVKEGKIKKSKPLPEITPDEIPYNLPKSWQWVRFGIIVQSMTNGLYKPSQFYSDKGVKIVRMFNIQDGFLDLEKVKRIEVTQEELENYKLSLGDILVNRVNSLELIGKSALVRDKDLQDNLVFEAMNIRVSCFFRETNLPNYANLLLQTINARSYLIGQAKRALGQVSINQPQVSNLLFPLPPLAEQHRIVAKIDQLMVLCDNLEKQIDNANSKQTTLLNAVVTKV